MPRHDDVIIKTKLSSVVKSLPEDHLNLKQRKYFLSDKNNKKNSTKFFQAKKK